MEPLSAFSGRFVIDWVSLKFTGKDDLIMPSLLPSVWTTIAPAVPYVWSCSECEAAFDMGPMHGALPTQSQIDELNHQFKAHAGRCTRVWFR